MAKKKWIKIMAVLALLWIIVWVVWTGLMVIFGENSNYSSNELSQEELQEIIENTIKKDNSWNTK